MQWQSLQIDAVSEQDMHAFEQSISARHDPNELGGKFIREFARGLPGVELPSHLSDKISRETIHTLANDSTVNTLTVCVCIMAWGGMHQIHRNKFFLQENNTWIQLAESIRHGKHTRQTAYESFAELQKRKTLPGVGPAYFTKLIYFLMPDDTPHNKPIGYIMDQWAGCSINLLFNSDIVLMDSTFIWKSTHRGLEHTTTFIVSNQNTGERYERFCSAIEVLKEHFGLTGHQIDRALLSTGGRQMASWRNHVILHRKPKQNCD